MRGSNALTSADPVDLGVQRHLLGGPEPRASRPSWADQIAAGRALLMTFYVTHRAAQDLGSARQAGWGSGAGSALRPGPARFCRRPGYGQVVVVASGLSWAAVLVAFVRNPGTGHGGSELGEGFCHRRRRELGRRGRARSRPRVAGHRRLGGPRPSLAPALLRTARGRIEPSGGRPGWPAPGPPALAPARARASPPPR